MLKTARFRVREDELNKALHPKKMEALWKSQVRSVLREQPVKDLHDYYDFHINLVNRIDSIRDAIFQGIYQPARPIRVRSEKKFGITRQLVILNPDDALIFETIGDYLMPMVEKAQPSPKAYFSRNKNQPKTPVDFIDNFGYPWWLLWPIFQKEIMDFSNHHDYTVVTDVANYYDGIDFVQLRNYLSSLGHLSEILLDFLFFLLERFVWRPDYLPISGKGLPQINLDTPRLVAHSFLFEVDSLLNEKTKGDFVRWMDDIDFGCDDKITAQRLLGNIDDLLLSRGLRLNPSKTKVLNYQEACEYFQIDENQYLSIFKNRLDRIILKYKNIDHPKIVSMKKRLRKRFAEFIKMSRIGHWGKVMKRYFNLASQLKDPFLETYIKEFLYSDPELRSTIFRYVISLNWSASREQLLIKYIEDCLDDDSFFGAMEVLIQWIPPTRVRYISQMRMLAYKLSLSNNAAHFLGGLWLMAKFGNSDDITKYVNSTIAIWKSNDWLARQVAAVWPRIENPETLDNIRNVINSFGLSSPKQVIDNYNLISSDPNTFSNKVLPFISAPMADNRYPLPKFLIALSILKGTLSNESKSNAKDKLMQVIDDPFFRYHIQKSFILPKQQA